MSERQSRWLLISVLAAQLVLLSAQVPDRGPRGTLLEGLALRGVAPFARLVSGAADGLESAAARLRSHRTLSAENRRLEAELRAREVELLRLAGVEQELARLSEALDYEPAGAGELIAADIVYVDHGSFLRTMILYAGDGVQVDQPVVAREGLVGRIVVVRSPYAKVQLVTDRASAVGAMIERTRRQGVARGAENGLLELDFVSLQADVRRGDRVVSAGIDGVYPRGLALGTVTQVEPGSELFHRIEVQPAVDFGQLDQVYVLGREALPLAELEGAADARP